MRVRELLLLTALSAAAIGSTKITVAVIEPKTGKPVTGLKAEDFIVFEDKISRQVEAVEVVPTPLDVVLLLDTSLVGATVQPAAAGLIAQLEDKDQMAVVAFHSSADLIQQFTSSKELLYQAVGKVRYGNSPRMLDAVYATIDGGFENSVYRRVILLLTTGLEGGGRISDKQVIRAARKELVSIVPIFVTGLEKHLFEELARQTGGSSFNLNDMRKNGIRDRGKRIFETLREPYTLTVAGNLSGDKLKIEVRGNPKLLVSALVQE